VVELESPVLTRARIAAFVVVGAAVGAWFVVAPHLPEVSNWTAIAIVAGVVMPTTLLLVLLALPLRTWRWLLLAAGVLVAVAFVSSELGSGLTANFAKLWAATFAGWAFLQFFEELSWVVIVAAVIPVVDAISVWRGPTHAIVANPKNFHIYTGVAIAFPAPGGGAAYLGPPDLLFYALFLAAAARWELRVGATWLAMTVMYSLTLVIANAAALDGLPALPFLSLGFLAANADLLWKRLRPAPSA
jgi:hypothetical protein